MTVDQSDARKYRIAQLLQQIITAKEDGTATPAKNQTWWTKLRIGQDATLCSNTEVVKDIFSLTVLHLSKDEHFLAKTFCVPKCAEATVLISGSVHTLRCSLNIYRTWYPYNPNSTDLGVFGVS